jgi:hypothetical protein
MGEDLLDHHWILDAGNDFHCAAAFTTCFDIDVEHAFQALCPGHGGAPFGGRWQRIGYLGLVAFAPLRRRDLRTVLAPGAVP